MPKSYVVAQMLVNDTEAYKSEYATKVAATVHKFGGSYLIRGGDMTQLEGSLPYNRVAVLEFPDKTTALAWYNSEDYQSIIDGRKNNADTCLNIIDGV
jgi:uncharacterized protein (DUF1330 family)